MTALIFVMLNAVDACLTRLGLSMGAEELNPLMAYFGGNIIAKMLIAAGIVLVLYLLRREKVLWYCNFGMLGIVLWNLAVCMILSMAIKLT